MRFRFSKISLVIRQRTTRRIPHRPSWWRRWRKLPPQVRRMMMCMVVLGAEPGCDRIEVPVPVLQSLTQLGLLEAKPEQPLLLDGICDHSSGAPCDRSRFEKAVAATALAAASRPGTVVRWWLNGSSAATTELLGEKTSPALPSRGARIQAAARAQFVKETTDYFLATTEHVFAAKPLRVSALTAAIGRVAVSDTHGLKQRVILFVTDLKEVSEQLDLECLASHKLPSPEAWAQLVSTRRLIVPESLTQTEVVFAYTALAPTLRQARCPAASVERDLLAKRLWETALRSSGATRVVFASGLPDSLLPLKAEH